MTQREKLIELILNAPRKDIVYGNIKLDKPVQTAQTVADHLLANGVIVPPCKVGDYVRFKGLTSLWRVDAIHYYREGLPQISVTNGKITTTVTDDGMFEVFTREEAEKALAERSEGK